MKIGVWIQYCEMCLIAGGDNIPREHHTYQLTVDRHYKCKVCEYKPTNILTKCDNCRADLTQSGSVTYEALGDPTRHKMKCTGNGNNGVCSSYWFQEHNYVNGKCSLCGESKDLGCSHTWKNATCTEPKTCTICGATEGSSLGHGYINYNYSISKHWKVCFRCGQAEKNSEESHNIDITKYTDRGNGKCSTDTCVCGYYVISDHIYSGGRCILCGSLQSTTCTHTGGTHANGGKCTTCQTVYQNHTMSTTPSSYTKDASGHTPVYKCTYSGCSTTSNGTKASHNITSWRDKGNGKHGGNCTVCDYEVTENHSYSNGVCTKCNIGCSHTGGTHENGGKCTTCQTVYQVHRMGTTPSSYTKDASGHTPVYKCTFSGCSTTSNGTKEDHTVTDWTDKGNGKHAGNCITCNYEVTENHIYSNGKCAKCNIACSHTGGTHANGGKCTTCQKIYQTHTMSTTPSSYTKDASGHTPVYNCTFSGCSTTSNGTKASHNMTAWTDKGNGKHGRNCPICNYEEKENHSGGTHGNGGKCSVCNIVYQVHNASNVLDHYEVVGNYHSPYYKCSFSGCNELISVTEGDQSQYLHTGATHENGGKCSVCEHVYQKHEKSRIILDYEKSETGHTVIYECTYLGCLGTYVGGEESHNITTWTDKGNGTHCGICTICEYELTAEHSFSNGTCTACGLKQDPGPAQCEHEYVIEKNGTQHWEKCSKCNQTKENSIQNHNVTTWRDQGNGTHSGKCTVCDYELTAEHSYSNGTCSSCGSKQNTEPTQCEHTYVIEKNETQHWEKCSKCNQAKENSLQNHNVETWTDKGDGTHSGKCIVCDYEITTEHSYSNGTCSSCGSKQNTEPIQCEHTYEIQRNGTQHWEKCSKCNQIKENSIQNHNVTTWTDKGNGTHSGKCTVCDYEIIENHSDGTSKNCNKCNYTANNNSNNNNNNNNSNNNNSGNNSSNSTTINGNNSNNSSMIDNTQATGKIPQTGINICLMIIIPIIVVVSGISAIKLKKYKEIK